MPYNIWDILMLLIVIIYLGFGSLLCPSQPGVKANSGRTAASPRHRGKRLCALPHSLSFSAPGPGVYSSWAGRELSVTGADLWVEWPPSHDRPSEALDFGGSPLSL